MGNETTKALSEDDKRLNRQINFLIMRKLWRTIRGRSEKGKAGEETIYKELGIGRTRYTRILDGEPVRFKKRELENWIAKTGMRREIFEGEDYFRFERISRKDWKELFQCRAHSMKEFRERERYLYNQTTKHDMDLLKNPDFYKFANYLKNGKAIIDLSIDDKIQEIIKIIGSLNLRQLEKCRSQTLRDYEAALQKQEEIVSTLICYNKLKEETD